MAGVKGRSGRKSRKAILGNAMDIMIKSAPSAAQYLADVVAGKIPCQKISSSRIDCAKYIIDQVHGKAPTKVQVSTPNGQALVTYTQLIMLAEQQINGPDRPQIEVNAFQLPDRDSQGNTTGIPCQEDCQEDNSPDS